MDLKSKKISSSKEKAQLITVGIGIVVLCILIFGIFGLIKSLDF